MTVVMPEPGDLVVVNTLNQVSSVVQILEYLSGRPKGNKAPQPGEKRYSQWNHVAVCTRVIPRTYEIWIAEAEPGGAVERPFHYQDVPHQWSTGIIPTNAAVAAAAVKYTRKGPWGDHGVPYSWLDYGAIAAYRAGLRTSELRMYLATTMHMICSEYGDQCKLEGGIHLFDDDRWSGFVRPSDIGALLPAWQPA